MESMATSHCANNDYNLLLCNEETCFEDSKPAVAGHSACEIPNPFEYTLKTTRIEQSAPKSSKTMKMPVSAPLEGLDVASHPSGEGDGARGSNSNLSATRTFFLRKNISPVGFTGFRSALIENSGPSRDHLFSTSGSAFPNSPLSTIHPSAAATQATNLVAIDGRRLDKETLIVAESVLDRLLKATRPCSPCNPKSVLERLKSKYTRLRGSVGAEEPPERVQNHLLPGLASTDFLTSVDAHPHVDAAIPPESLLDMFGNIPSAKAYAAYASIAVELASPPLPHHSLLAPAPIIYEGCDGMKPLAQYQAMLTYGDRHLLPLAPAISPPADLLERREAAEASGRASISIDTVPSMKRLAATQGYPSGPLLLNSGQAHLDSLGSLRHGTAAYRPPDLSPGPTSYGFEAEAFGSRLDYDSFFFPSLPARKGTPPPENFGKSTTTAPPSTRPRAHSSPPYGCDDMATKFVTVFTNDLGDSDWPPPFSWETGQWPPQRSCSPSSESDSVYTGGAVYDDSPYRSVYFEYDFPSLSRGETSEEGSVGPIEGEATPKSGDLYKK